MGVCQSMSALPQKAVRLDPSQRKIGDDVINLFVPVCFLPSGLAKTNGLVRWDVGAICFWGAGPAFKAKGAAGEKRPLRWRAEDMGTERGARSVPSMFDARERFTPMPAISLLAAPVDNGDCLLTLSDSPNWLS